MLEITMLPAYNDNYEFILHDDEVAIAVDPGDPVPVIQFMRNIGRSLNYIFNTHHHADHIGGNLRLKKAFTDCQMFGSRMDQHRISGMDRGLVDGEVIYCGAHEFKIILTVGHTSGHICYYSEKLQSLFCGDTLFSLGCGRLFEGTAHDMFQSLQRLKSLPDDTKVYCAHEYTESNAKFLESLGELNIAQKVKISQIRNLRSVGKPTIPTTIGSEKLTNPFLLAPTVEEFARIRSLKDRFRS